MNVCLSADFRRSKRLQGPRDQLRRSAYGHTAAGRNILPSSLCCVTNVSPIIIYPRCEFRTLLCRRNRRTRPIEVPGKKTARECVVVMRLIASVCLSVCPVRTLTAENPDLGTSLLDTHVRLLSI